MSDLCRTLIDMLPPAAKANALEADDTAALHTAVSSLGLSSTQLIEYVMRIESEFDVAVGDMDIIEFGEKSINELADLLRTRME
jgi:acyl carrier protein